MGSISIIEIAWTLSCNRISVQSVLCKTEYIIFWTMWQWRKLRQLTDWKKSWDSKYKTRNPKSPGHSSTQPGHIYLLSLDLLPRGTYWKTFSCFFCLFPYLSKKENMPTLLFLEFWNSSIVHSLPLQMDDVSSIRFHFPYFYPFQYDYITIFD